jgi:hypothetical protein
MSSKLTVNQATDFTIGITTSIDGVPLSSVSQAKYCLYGARNVKVLEKTLGDGITFADGKITVTFTEADTFNLEGSYTQECLVRNAAGTDVLALKGSIQINKILTRL